LKIALSVLLLAVLSASADISDLSGQWAGNVSTESRGQPTVYPFVLVLRVEDTTITGTMGPQDGKAQPIKNARLKGDQLTFEVDSDDVKVRFNLTLAGERLKGDIGGSDGAVSSLEP